ARSTAMWPLVLSQGRPVPLPVSSISRMRRSPQARNRLRPLARLIPPGSPHRSMSASTTRPVRHNIPSHSPSLRGHMRMASCVPGELIPCAFVWHDPGITPCCIGAETYTMPNASDASLPSFQIEHLEIEHC